jgi:hypothetical protein
MNMKHIIRCFKYKNNLGLIGSAVVILRQILSNEKNLEKVKKDYPNIDKFLYDLLETYAHNQVIVTQIMYSLCHIQNKGDKVTDLQFTRFCKSLFSTNEDSQKLHSKMIGGGKLSGSDFKKASDKYILQLLVLSDQFTINNKFVALPFKTVESD